MVGARYCFAVRSAKEALLLRKTKLTENRTEKETEIKFNLYFNVK